MLRIGLISDTHGLLRPEVRAFLDGCIHIVHAGDVCEPGILQSLSAIAPVTAVRGNNDGGAWADALPTIERVRFGSVCVAVVHDLADLDRHAVTGDVRVVVHGHSHRPAVDVRDGTLYVNPGSAGPRRFALPIAAGELRIDGDAVSAHIEVFADPRAG